MKLLSTLVALCLVTSAFAKPTGPIQFEMAESKKSKGIISGSYQIDFSLWSSTGPATYDVALRTLPSSGLEITSKRSLSFKKTAADKKMTFPILVKLSQDASLPNTLVVDVTQHHDGGSSSQTIPVRLPLTAAAVPEKLMQKSK